MAFIQGSSSSEILIGTKSNDELFGGSGSDTIIGEGGVDRLYGGEGNDTYILSEVWTSLYDIGGTDVALVNANFVKPGSGIENWIVSPGFYPLPYWVDALVAEEAITAKRFQTEAVDFHYTFPDTPPTYLYGDADLLTGWAPFSATQKEYTREVFRLLTTLTGLRFVETEVSNKPNTISLQNNLQTNSSGFAFYPSDLDIGSDVFIANTKENQSLVQSSRGIIVLLHEIGHAIGLKHPFNNLDHGGVTTAPPYLNFAEDSPWWTVMTYVDMRSYALRLGPLDIAALQYLYGVNKTTNSINNNYVVDPNSSNFIWDGDGLDTIDASSILLDVNLSLKEGIWSWIDKKGVSITDSGQLTININSKIENLIGGSGNDRLEGNSLANKIFGGPGNDSIDGAEGIDTVSYHGLISNYKVICEGNQIVVSDITSLDGTDTLIDIERLHFSDKCLAFDLQGKAGSAARLLGTVFGKSAVQNPTYAGILINFFDEGYSKEQLSDAALETIFGDNPNSRDVVSLVWKNLFGREITSNEYNDLTGLIDSKGITTAQLVAFVMDIDLTASVIDLVGLSKSGWDYIPYRG